MIQTLVLKVSDEVFTAIVVVPLLIGLAVLLVSVARAGRRAKKGDE